MFEDEQREFSFVSWILQLMLGTVGPLIVLAALESRLGSQDAPWEAPFDYIVLAPTAFAMAWILSAVSGDSAREGKWIWIMPMSAEIASIAWDVLWLEHASIRGYFWDRGPEGMQMLLTLPTWSSCWYSAAMWLRLCMARKARLPSVRSR